MIAEILKPRSGFFLFSLITKIIPKKWPQFLILGKVVLLVLWGLVCFPALKTGLWQLSIHLTKSDWCYTLSEFIVKPVDGEEEAPEVNQTLLSVVHFFKTCLACPSPD